MKIIVTGASRGLGAALTKKLIHEGHEVYALLQSIHRKNELDLVKECGNLHVIEADLSDQKDIDLAVEIIKTQTEYIDVIINVAGVLLKKQEPLTSNTYYEMETTLKVNTLAPIYLNNLVLPMLNRSREPVIVNICSEIRSIDDVGDWFPIYCISKTALTQYVFSMDKTLRKQESNVRVFAVHPGRMKTAMGGENGEISPDESADGIIEIIKNPEGYSHLYIDYNGKAMI